MDDAVGVDVEGYLDLGDSPRRRRDADQVEAAERAVLVGHLALALEHVDGDGGLAVRRGREDLALAVGDRGVAVDELSEDAAQGLDAEGEGRDIEKKDILDLAAEDAALDGGADRDDFVGVDALGGSLPKMSRTTERRGCASSRRRGSPRRSARR